MKEPAKKDKQIDINSILKGFENNEFETYFQFILNNKTKKIVSAEALSRWQSKEKGLLLPGKYIKTMEQEGIINKLDFLMFENACKQLEEWNNSKFDYLTISCNFTRITLSEVNFIEKIKNISQKYNFEKSKLAIEITEDSTELNRNTAIQNAKNCKELGFKIYLDDMGSGYTPLTNLCEYPIDVLKIDRDILLKTDTLKGKKLFTGIISLAHNLNMSVICEGIETKNQDLFISSTDCDYVQGWYYFKPIPIIEAQSLIKNKQCH